MVKPLALALALALLLPSLALAARPIIDRPVVDLRGVLTPDERESVATELLQLREETGVQMAVLLIGTTAGQPIEDYSLEVAQEWRGGEKGRDNGLLFVLAIADHRMRLEVGYGLEEYLPDDLVRELLDEQHPKLKNEDPAGALHAIIQGVRGHVPRLDGTELHPAWRAPEVGRALMGILGGGLVAGLLLGLFLVRFRAEQSLASQALVVALLVGLPLLVVAFAVRDSQKPMSDFLLGQFVFTGVFCLAVLAWFHVTWRLGVGIAAGTLVAGFVTLDEPRSSLVLPLLKTIAMLSPVYGGIIFIALFSRGGLFGGRRTYGSGGWMSSGSSGSSGSSWTSSSSSSSSSSYHGGGGSFGGGGASSSW